MINFSKSYTFLAAMLCLIAVSCAPSTRITGTWSDPQINDTYDNVLIAAMTENVQAKQVIEDALATHLRAQGIKVSKSIDVFPPNFTQENMDNKDAMLDAIRTDGHDAILTVALIDEETETRYVPGSAAYAPVNRFSYYGNFWGYYSHWGPQVYDPGYYAEDKIYFLESNLYDADSEKLVWSAQSESINPGTLENFSQEFAAITVDELSDDQLL